MRKRVYQPTLYPQGNFCTRRKQRLLLVVMVVGGIAFGNATTTIGQSTAPAQDLAIQSDTSRLLVEKINAIRRLASLPPVDLDGDLSRACRLHAQYLVTNRENPKAQGLGAHTERQELPGYTAEGNKAASASDIFWGRDIAGAVERWMAGLYHRIPILRPNLKRIGLGYQEEVVVLDVISGIVGFDLDSVAYPSDGQANVPTEFGGDTPDPLPKGAPRQAGYPITLLFPFAAKVSGVEAELIDSAGTKIEIHLSDPERPATGFPQQSTVCLIPIKPLVENTAYKVSIKANVDGREVRKSWSFLTREAQTRK
ncbi:MAG TPA: CAP domain-containing protein [Blastocatellia bacterium]|nr:CAP domain-containing protein [Blastocatellia bacterium]